MRRTVLLCVLALAVGACGTLEPRVVSEVVRFTCPQEEPPELYTLPDRLSSVRPEHYRIERLTVEGRHNAFRERYDAYLMARALCPKAGEEER